MSNGEGIGGIFDIFTGFGCLVIVLGSALILAGRCA